LNRPPLAGTHNLDRSLGVDVVDRVHRLSKSSDHQANDEPAALSRSRSSSRASFILPDGPHFHPTCCFFCAPSSLLQSKPPNAFRVMRGTRSIPFVCSMETLASSSHSCESGCWTLCSPTSSSMSVVEIRICLKIQKQRRPAAGALGGASAGITSARP